MVHVNYKSDFIVKELFQDSNGDIYPLPDNLDVTITYRTSHLRSYTASRIGGVYTNCAPSGDGGLLVLFNDHGLDRGYLTRVAETNLLNGIMPDGGIMLYNPGQTDIELWEYESEIYGVIQAGVIANYMKGAKGDTGEEGKQGPPGPEGPQGPAGYGAVWGNIGGALTDQADLQQALNAKANQAMQIVEVGSSFSNPLPGRCYVFKNENLAGYQVTISDALPDGCHFYIETFGLTNLWFNAGVGISKIAFAGSFNDVYPEFGATMISYRLPPRYTDYHQPRKISGSNVIRSK
jgi:hypothetical protein